MQTFLYYLTMVAVAGVITVLLAGLWSMLVGTSPNLSQNLMRARVLLQLFAIVVIVAFILMSRT